MLTELFKKLWFKGNWQNKQKHKNIISMVLIYHHDRAKIYHGDPVWPSHVDKSACRRVLWILLVLSRLSPRCGFLPRLTWTHPPPLPPHLVLLRFVLIFPCVVVGSTLPTPRSTPAWLCTSCCHFDGCFRFFCGVCHRFAPSLLYIYCNTWSTGFCAEHLKLFSIWPFTKPWFTHMLWFKLKQWFEQNQCFCVQTIFYTVVLHKNCVIHKHHVLHENHVLAGPVLVLFAAYTG